MTSRIVAQCYFLAYDVREKWLTKDLEYARKVVRKLTMKEGERVRELETGNS